MAIHIKNPPEAKPERISRLVTRVEQGDVKIPVFQRKFVWRSPQVLELLDSIYRGYPIGSLLFWLASEPLATERDLADFALPPTPDKYPRNYVLDGQQRLATVFAVLRWQGKPEDESIFNVSFDLQTEAFVRTPVPLPRTSLPMNILFDTRRFREFQNSLLPRPDGQDLLDKSDVLLETFREYAIPIVTVTEATVEHVSTIFERINSTGTKLTVFDLMVAATWSEQFDLRDRIETALDELRTKRFGGISPVAVLQVLAAHTDGSAKRDSILALRKHATDELTSRMDEIVEAIRKSVDFLRNDVDVKSDDFLPYERQLVVLAFVYAKLGTVDAPGQDLLKRWFWRTSFSERYRRGGEGLFDEDINSVVSAVQGVESLDRFGTAATGFDLVASEFRRNSALSNALIAFLGLQGPRNLLNGSRIDTEQALSAFNRKQFHHIFPQAYLRGKGVSVSRSNALGNICMLSAEQNRTISDRAPSDYVAGMKAELGAQFLPVLESNLIPEAAVSALLNDDYDTFLKVRAEHIASSVSAAA